MGFMRAIPLLLGVLMGSLVGVLAWGFWRVRRREVDCSQIDDQGSLLVALSALAVLALSISVLYLFLGLAR